jgi:hypothetical protein
MAIIETIMTIAVFGLVAGIWLLSLNLDELTDLFVKLMGVALVAAMTFLLFSAFRKQF